MRSRAVTCHTSSGETYEPSGHFEFVSLRYATAHYQRQRPAPVGGVAHRAAVRLPVTSPRGKFPCTVEHSLICHPQKLAVPLKVQAGRAQMCATRCTCMGNACARKAWPAGFATSLLMGRNHHRVAASQGGT